MFLLFQLLVEQGYTDFENLHSNMFLLFLTSNLIKSLLDFIYIPICFYYFQDEHIFIENGISFTFQYVSIISQQCQKEAQFTAIYIPICFYYFPSIPSALIPSGSSFTFQYVSIISRFPFLATLITYIFTFQYVSIISDKTFMFDKFATIYIPICFYYFNGLRRKEKKPLKIYIPICFYYFRIDSPTSISNVSIYIPICFYYFGF